MNPSNSSRCRVVSTVKHSIVLLIKDFKTFLIWWELGCGLAAAPRWWPAATDPCLMAITATASWVWTLQTAMEEQQHGGCEWLKSPSFRVGKKKKPRSIGVRTNLARQNMWPLFITLQTWTWVRSRFVVECFETICRTCEVCSCQCVSANRRGLKSRLIKIRWCYI